ncbi:MAG: response regulator [bacterium]
MKTILLVDPDPFARNVFSRTLRNRGYRVLDCAGPMDARTLATGCDVDLIVADTRLTTGVGNLIRGYRADGFSGPTVVVTSMLEPEDVDVEVTLLLHRPLSPAELAFEIEHLVSPESLELDDGMTEIASIEIEFSVRLSQMLATLHTMVESRDAASLRDLLPNVIEEARQSGLARVAQPLARALAALTDARSRESWQPVADALDDTFVEARAAAATTTDASQFLVCTRDHALHETLAIIAREHLIGLKVATPEHVSPMLAADRYDGLFIDLDLQPPLDVSGFVASLRSRSASRDIPVSFLSSGKRIEHRVEAALAGATRFVEKPLVVSAFLDAAQHMAALVRAGNPSVLVVESDESCAREICQMIAAEDVNAWSSGRVDAIFDLLEQYDPDVLILGTEFQAISGLDVCRILRTSPRWSDLPVLVVTEHSGARMRIAAYQAGADDVLLKPLLREELVARLRVRIERIRLTRERADRDSLTGLLTRRAF